MSKYLNLLAIDQRSKGIPYPGSGHVRPDGFANHGFKNLKVQPKLVHEVPELAADAALMELVETMNLPGSGTFTVGCMSAPVQEDQGHRFTGYVEFALNSRAHVTDAGNYFPVFFHFDRFLHENNYRDGVKFDWEMMGAVFTECGVSGFTCTVYINTPFVESPEQTAALWQNAIEALVVYFRSSAEEASDPLYLSPSTANGTS